MSDELTRIRKRLGELLALCGGDQRGPALAIPGHPRVDELQAEWGQLRRRFRELASQARQVRPRHDPKRPRRIHVPRAFRQLKDGKQPGMPGFPHELFED